jgi:hypothetical protein
MPIKNLLKKIIKFVILFLVLFLVIDLYFWFCFYFGMYNTYKLKEFSPEELELIVKIISDDLDALIKEYESQESYWFTKLYKRIIKIFKS